jgi:hypothetical protein
MYAHDPQGQAKEEKINKYSRMWKYWRPEPSFVKKLVVSWDLIKVGLSGGDMIALEGTCKQRPMAESHVIRHYAVMSEDNQLGEFMAASTSRFKHPASERRVSEAHDVENHTCFKCSDRSWPMYRRYLRALPEDGDTRWI